MPDREFIIGTRVSRLALRQAELAAAALRAALPHATFRLEYIRSTGDLHSRDPLSNIGSQGVFVGELESSLRNGDIDIAVHSLKDMPCEESPGLTLAAITVREDPRDALVSGKGHDLASLPQGAKLGTGSPRRAAQLAAARPDLRITDIRGNVDTRIHKAQTGEVDAVVLAVAGLSRLGWLEQASEILPVDTMLPAVGQGALALQVRADDDEALQVAGTLEHLPTRLATSGERSFLRHLGGGCRAAAAALGEVTSGSLRLRGLATSMGGQLLLQEEVRGQANHAESLGALLANRLLTKGADSFTGVPL